NTASPLPMPTGCPGSKKFTPNSCASVPQVRMLCWHARRSNRVTATSFPLDSKCKSSICADRMKKCAATSNAGTAISPENPSSRDNSPIFNWFALFLSAAAMTLFSSPRAVAQGSSDSSQQTETNTQQEPAQPQSDQRRVISKDTIPQNNPDAEDSQDRDEAAPQQRTP